MHLLRLIRSLRQTANVAYELVVVDNRSASPTRLLLQALVGRGINTLTMLDRNLLFAGGVNAGLRSSDATSRYVLLLNPDVVVQDPAWLRKMLDVHARGATSLGYVEDGPWPRADGYCFMIDRDLITTLRGLSADFQWWWAITKLQADLMQQGHTVQAVKAHDNLVTHVGGASGPPPVRARGMQTDEDTIRSWFAGQPISVIEAL